MRKEEFLENLGSIYYRLVDEIERLEKKIKAMDNPPDVKKELQEIDYELNQLQCLLHDY
ncbi:hypothetical protein ACOR62_08820 [Neisseria lisongii]|uniref:Uncharacterized protein n=1 Tax=Neisseria lisongii TaxID=2912188 RepID=A0AAW5AM96_9NEIS|nr:hypothetical protein [Neisseria lisongii]MCF7530314.1 hypothetical protein [Neisseria lisongii]